ncbi:lipoprotein [Ralstonia mannitolilytica]|uniref:lipoprotein n=1 Tax=Ralstonia mannitolilytica TaxID=105219 RepID=UPI003749787F
MKKYIVLALLTLALTACNQNQDKNQGQKEGSVVTPSSLSGTYSSGKNTFVFTSDGKVTAKTPHFSDQVTTYTVQDGKVTFKFPQGYPISMSLNSDGSLTSDSNINYTKTE